MVRVLAAEDDAISRKLLMMLLGRWGYDIVPATNGAEAWDVLRSKDPPRLLLLDWMMPEIDGLELCQRIRSRENGENGDYSYIILLTAREQKQDIVKGLEAGADDYVTKPYNQAELRSRIRSGERIVRLKQELGQKITELEAAFEQVQQLEGLLPICMHCKSIRDDKKVWHRMENYIEHRSGVNFSHALCDDCLNKYYPDVD